MKEKFKEDFNFFLCFSCSANVICQNGLGILSTMEFRISNIGLVCLVRVFNRLKLVPDKSICNFTVRKFRKFTRKEIDLEI